MLPCRQLTRAGAPSTRSRCALPGNPQHIQPPSNSTCFRPCSKGRAVICTADNAYDNPALYSNEDAVSLALLWYNLQPLLAVSKFSLSSYWDERYKRENGAPFEWYRGYDGLEPLLSRHLDKSQPLLHVGVGTSRIQYQMALDGYSSIVNVDYAPACIEQLSAAHAHVPALSYAVADCRTMPQYGDGSYGGVLDKGTLDALLCGDTDEADSGAMLREVLRVLRPGCPYICITHAPPRARLPYLVRPEQGVAWGGVAFYEVGQQGRREGPVEVAGLSVEELAAYPRQSYSHFMYVCTK